MLTVHSYERIRHAHVVEGKSIRQIGREYGHGYWTVRKVLEQSEPQPYQLSQAKDVPVLGAYKEQIEAMLVENERLPRKQRYTSRKIYRALRETGYQGAASTGAPTGDRAVVCASSTWGLRPASPQTACARLLHASTPTKSATAWRRIPTQLPTATAP